MLNDDVPADLGIGGSRLWAEVTEAHELDEVQRVQLLEACRAKDRLDKLDELLRGDVDTWARLSHRSMTDDSELVIDKALDKANQTANQLKQLLAALRLPDEQTGKRPQRRGARGAYKPRAGGAKVSSLDRARAAKSGA